MNPPAGRGSRLAGPVAAMLATDLLMALGDALVKDAVASLPLCQIYVLRALLAMPLLLLPPLLTGRPSLLRPHSVRWVALRSALLMAMWLAFYAALARASLAIVAAGTYLGPLLIVLLSRLLLGERIPAHRLLAVALGFAGVLVALRPSAAGFAWPALPAIGAAALYALAAVVTRQRCAGESPLLLSLGLNLGFLAIGLAGSLAAAAWPATAGFAPPHLLGPWAPMGRPEWALMAALAAIIVAVTAGVALAYQRGPPSIIAAVDYSYLVFAALWGRVLLGERPDLPQLVGLGMIVLAGAAALVPGSAYPRRANAAATSVSTASGA